MMCELEPYIPYVRTSFDISSTMFESTSKTVNYNRQGNVITLMFQNKAKQDIAANAVIGTLPADLVPVANLFFEVLNQKSIWLKPNGDIALPSGIGNGQWLYACITYVV